MQGDKGAEVYLRSDTKIEPLAARWYAWMHLISPVQRAFNVAFRHAPILESFVANPSVHEAACKDPEFYGAPFLHLTRDDTAAVNQLMAETARQCAGLIRFAQDFKQLVGRLQETAKGYSVEDLYKSLPESLQGLVELTYDVSNRPSARIIESHDHAARLCG
jgi:hypothetical protein